MRAFSISGELRGRDGETPEGGGAGGGRGWEEDARTGLQGPAGGRPVEGGGSYPPEAGERAPDRTTVGGEGASETARGGSGRATPEQDGGT